MTKHTPTLEIITDGELACLNVDGKLFSAPYVVTAVNSHEELIEQLKFLRDSLELDEHGHYTGYITVDSLKEVDAIIAKSEVK